MQERDGAGKIGERRLRTRQGAGVYQTGRDRIAQILDVALTILVEHGYEAMTLREVARRCKVQIGAISHYYRSRSDLLQDVLNAVLADYAQRIRAIEKAADLDAEQKLERVIGLLLEDMQGKQTTRLFPHLWQLANHDPFVAKIVDSIYVLERLTLNRLIARINPTLGEEARDTLSVFVSSAIAGSTMFIGFEKPWGAQLPLYRAIACKGLVDMVKTLSVEQLAAHGWRPEDSAQRWKTPTILSAAEFSALVEGERAETPKAIDLKAD